MKIDKCVNCVKVAAKTPQICKLTPITGSYCYQTLSSPMRISNIIFVRSKASTIAFVVVYHLQLCECVKRTVVLILLLVILNDQASYAVSV